MTTSNSNPLDQTNDVTDPQASGVIARLQEHQSDQSDERFCRRWLPGVSATTWGRIKRGVYGAKDQSAVLAKLEAGLRGIEEATAARKANRSGLILPLSPVKRVAQAVALAEHEDRDRFVVYLSPTGGGKTKMAAWLAERYHGRAVLVETTETWRDSYLVACLTLCRALGYKPQSETRRDAEKALLDGLRDEARIIILDEAHYLGRESINLVKAILNASPRSIVVALAIPVLWERMGRAAWAEADQLRNRTKAITRCDQLVTEDIQTFLTDRLGADAMAAIIASRPELIHQTAEACKWGLWAEAERIADDALELAGDDEAVTADDLAAAITGRKATR